MAEYSPTVRHRRLASELRALRESAGLSPENAAAALGWSRPKLVRFETAKAQPKPADVAAILDLYGCEESLRLALMQLARDIRKRGWWTAYDDVLTGPFAELEDVASEIKSWQIELIPGLLQTEQYAFAMIRSGDLSEEELDRRLQARMTRKTLLARQNAPKLTVILGEVVLRRVVGDAATMQGQLQSLLASGQRPNVSIRIVPMSAGLHPGLGEGSFVIFGFPSPMELDVVYLESAVGDVYVEEIEQVRRCNLTFSRISDVALSEEDSAHLIADIAKEYTQSHENPA
ncbi:helix-turn-helix transcriptional regulator [Actinomadura fulvescens]|uniref:Helix-turn-helix transcriptional regulator n=1 Tax=Actinomadura fulvescens TaxID=46160 RepID=A0ABP6CK85_9ACTN